MQRTHSRALSFALAVCVQVSAPALAHPRIDQAEKSIETAEFDTALRLLAEAEAGADLTREDALRLLELRALVHLALTERERAAETLLLLAVLSPDHSFGKQTSPDLVAEFKRAQKAAPPAPRLAIERTLRPDGVRLFARISGDELGLARSVRLWTRVGAQPWRSTLAVETIVLASPGERVEYRADAHGLGGAPLFDTAPQAFVIPPGHDAEVAAGPGTSPWLYAGVVGGVLAVAGVTALLLLGGESDTTRVSPPMVVEP